MLTFRAIPIIIVVTDPEKGMKNYIKMHKQILRAHFPVWNTKELGKMYFCLFHH